MVRVTCPEGRMQSNEPPKLHKTVRVLKPPGGGSSISFGDGNEDYTSYRKRGAAPVVAKAKTNGVHKEEPKPVAEEPKTPSEPTPETPEPAAAESSNETAEVVESSPPAETVTEKVPEVEQNGAGKAESTSECMVVDSTVVSESVSSSEVSSSEVTEVASKEVTEATSELSEVVLSNEASKISLEESVASVAIDVSIPNEPKVASPLPDDSAPSFPIPSEFAQKSEPCPPSPSISDVQPTLSTPDVVSVPSTPDAQPIMKCPPLVAEKPVEVAAPAAPAPTRGPQPKKIPDHMRSSIFNPTSHDYVDSYRSREPPKKSAPAPAPAPVEAPQRRRIPPGGYSTKLW